MLLAGGFRDITVLKIQPTVFFYNPNIHPKKEYEIRKEEDKRFCEKLGIKHVDVDYDSMNWFDRIKGLEWEPEGVPLHAVF